MNTTLSFIGDVMVEARADFQAHAYDSAFIAAYDAVIGRTLGRDAARRYGALNVNIAKRIYGDFRFAEKALDSYDREQDKHLAAANAEIAEARAAGVDPQVKLRLAPIARAYRESHELRQALEAMRLQCMAGY